jgi:hypothetical protein
MVKLANAKTTAELLELKKATREAALKTYHESRDQNPQVVRQATIWAAELQLIETVLDSLNGRHLDLRCLF